MIKHGAVIPHLPVFSVPLSFFTLTGSSLGLPAGSKGRLPSLRTAVCGPAYAA